MTRTRRLSGFSLVELMIVVVIVGILAAIAIPAFTAYMQKSKTSEATTFIGEIKQRQEAFRAEFGRYASPSAGPADVWPVTAYAANGVAWGAPAPGSGWSQLGARPDGYVRFRYSCVSGLPATTPAAGGFGSALGYDGSDFWFVTQARADLDVDGTIVTFEGYSAGSSIYVSQASGWE